MMSSYFTVMFGCLRLIAANKHDGEPFVVFVVVVAFGAMVFFAGTKLLR
jgi:hypothetical protein